MFCPKCGTQNPDDGKFCRSCGVDLGNVNAAISGQLAVADDDSCSIGGRKKPRTADDMFAHAMKSIVTGIGFIVVSCVLYMTNVANGQAWFWALLIPAFTFLATGISYFSRSRRMERSQQGFQPTATVNQMRGVPPSTLPSAQTTFIAPAESRYKTGDLAPSSVTDNTTRHLEANPEGETITLPKVQ